MTTKQILLVDDDPERYIDLFIMDLEESIHLDIELEQNYENVLEKIDQMRGGLKIIILDVMARKYNSLYGRTTYHGFNAGLVLLDLIEEKLANEGWREQISIIIRSARQDLSQNYFSDKNIKFFTREQIEEIKDYIKTILKMA